MLKLNQKFKIKWAGANRKHYESIINEDGTQKYIFTKGGDEFEVDLWDLTKSNTVMIKLDCDYCGNEFERKFCDYVKNLNTRKIKKDCCNSCKGEMIREMQIKYTFEEALKIFKQNNMIITDDESEYKNIKTILNYECAVCGHKARTSLSEVLNGVGCKRCVSKKMGNKYKHSYEYVKSVFNERGFTLLSKEYINGQQKLDYICKCGELATATFNKVQSGKSGCLKCSPKNRGYNNRKYTYADFKILLENEGYKFLEKVDLSIKINSNHDKAKYECPNSHFHETTYDNFIAGKRCPFCVSERMSELHRHDIEHVRELLNQKGYELLSSNYINYGTNLIYKCKCGNVAEGTLGNILKNSGCVKCSPSSKAEVIIENYLSDKNIKYKRQWKFKDCRNIHVLPFDFAILGNEELPLCLIEYDGQQHFMPIERFGGIEEFHNVRKRDTIKNDYCLSNGYFLFRIPFWEKDNINEILNSIFLDLDSNEVNKSKYLVTNKNKDTYFQSCK